MIESNLPRAFTILLIFYAIGGLISIVQGEPVTAFSIPELDLGGGAVQDLINAGITIINALITLITMPAAVIGKIDFGIESLTILVKSFAYILLAYAYIVIISSLKNMVNPLH